MSAKSALRILYSVPLLGLVLFVFSTGFPPFDDATTLDLTTHMVQHVLIVAAGILVAYPLHRKGRLKSIEGRNSALVGLAALVVLVALWHTPGYWDAAVLNPLTHAVEHLSFLFVGALIGSTLQALSDRAKIDALLLGFFGHFIYGLILISPYRIYPLYSLADQAVLGDVMFGVGPFYWVGIFYLIYRNKAWFREVTLGGEVAPHATARPSYHSMHRRLRLVAPVSTVVLVGVLVAFYGFSAVAIGLAPSQQQPSQVTIVETPVSWQFSPQDIRVVLGVNSTVLWVSHSLSYDTVTGENGSFSSGPIAPGSTFAYTFTSAGTYRYYCLYHPWMVGTVTVTPPQPQKG